VSEVGPVVPVFDVFDGHCLCWPRGDEGAAVDCGGATATGAEREWSRRELFAHDCVDVGPLGVEFEHPNTLHAMAFSKAMLGTKNIW
jgi:hypothetical protein